MPCSHSVASAKRLPSLLASAGALLVLVAAGVAAESATAATEPEWGGPRNYEVRELTPIINQAIKGGRDFARGERLFESVGCSFCHHASGGSGGIGPELAGAGSRFGAYSLLTEIIEPSTYISDLFGTKTVMRTDGTAVTGRVMTQNSRGVTLSLNFTVDPSTGTATWIGGNTVDIPADEIEWIDDSGVSPMPRGLLNNLKEDEVADLVAFLLSNGDPNDRMFQPLAPTGN